MVFQSLVIAAFKVKSPMGFWGGVVLNRCLEPLTQVLTDILCIVVNLHVFKDIKSVGTFSIILEHQFDENARQWLKISIMKISLKFPKKC